MSQPQLRSIPGLKSDDEMPIRKDTGRADDPIDASAFGKAVFEHGRDGGPMNGDGAEGDPANGTKRQAEDTAPASPLGDDLATALSQATIVLGVPRTPQSLTSGLVLTDGQLGPSGFCDAAMRAGIELAVARRPLAKISELDLPAIAMLQDGTAVTLRRSAKPKEVFDIKSRCLLERDGFEQAYAGEIYRLSLNPANHDMAATPRDDGGLKSWLLRSLKIDWSIYAIGLAATLVINLLGVAAPLFIMSVYDRILPTGAMESLAVLATGMALAGVLDVLLRQMRTYLMEVAGRRLSVPVSNTIFARVLGTRLAARSGSSGSVANAVRDGDNLLNIFQSATLAVLGDLPFLVIFALVMYMVAGSLAFVLIILIPLVLLGSVAIQLLILRQSRRHHAMSVHRNTVLFDVLGGLESIKAAGAESWAAGKWERSYAAELSSRLPVNSLTALNGNLLHGARIISTIAVVVIGVQMVLAGDLTQGGLIAAVMLSGRALAPLGAVVQALGRLHAARLSYQSLKPILSAEVERPDNAQFSYHPKLHGQVAFDEVSLAYPKPQGVPAELYPTVNALKGLTFKIYQGERVGILGPVGSGKSSLLKLILGLYRPTEGLVTVDGLDVNRLEPADLRRQIGYVPQNPHFFLGSIRQNLTFHQPDAEDAQLQSALRIAGAAPWVEACPMGLDQPVGERGEALSGGQRQTLALARAMVANPPLLLLDEPTSMIDAKGEADYIAHLSQCLRGKTLIMVTHRPAMLALVDRLIVIDRGRLVLDGHKQEVLARLQQGVQPSQTTGEGDRQ